MAVFVDVKVGVVGLRDRNEALETKRRASHANSFEKRFIAILHVLLPLKPGICDSVSLLLPPLLPLVGPFSPLFFPLIRLAQRVFVEEKPLTDLQTLFFFLLLGASCAQRLPLTAGCLLLLPSLCLKEGYSTNRQQTVGGSVWISWWTPCNPATPRRNSAPPCS